METDENLTALKRNCTDLIYKTTKDATSRIMILEERALLFQRELQLAKEETFGMQKKLQEMIDSKISEAELRSLSQQRKIDELEAQLHEAEDIVYDLRAELRKVQVEPERVRRSNEDIARLQDLYAATPAERPEKNMVVPPLESQYNTVTTSNTEAANVNQNMDNIATNGCVRAHLTPARDNSPTEDSSGTESDEPDRGFTEVSDDEPEFVEETGVHDAIEEHEGLMGNLDRSERDTRSMESLEVPASRTDTDTDGNQFVDINNLCNKLLNSKSMESKVNSGTTGQHQNDRTIKHKFQRKRKRDLRSVPAENASKFMESETGSTSKTAEHAYTPPGPITRGRGRKFSALGSLNKNCILTASNQNEIAQDNDLVPPGFDRIEDALPLQEAEVLQNSQRREISILSSPVPLQSKKTKRGRGKNKLRSIAGLQAGEKLSVTFYQNRVVGEHYATFVRHLGMLVRDRNMCPLRVHSWTDIEEDKLERMWQAVIDKFDSADMNDQRYHVLKHMRNLWNKWRAAMHMKVKSKPVHEALKDVPEGVDKGDWEWLINEHFSDEKFKEASTRNSVNRSKSSMPSRTGSKPIREIIYELGGKDGYLPDMATIWFETHKKGDKLVEPETHEKYAQIQELVQDEPSLTHIEVVEKCFGPQRNGVVRGFGGGITPKEMKGGKSSKTKKTKS